MKAFLASIAAVAITCGTVHASDFPTRALRIVVPFASGTASDNDARFYGDLLAKKLGQPVIVDNRPGGSGVIGVQTVKQLPADGYTILLASNSPMVVNPIVMKSLPYDPFKDLKPVTGVTYSPSAFLVKGNSPYRKIKDVVNTAKVEKKPVAIGNYSAGYQLVAALLGTATATDITHVAYRGGPQLMTDIMGGQLEMGAMEPSSAMTLINSGQLRVLAVTGKSRYPLLPEVPTMMEEGFSDFETYVWSSMFVRTETPPEVTEKLADAMMEILVSDAANTYRKKQGGTTPLVLKTDEMRAFQKREYERFKKVAETAGIKKQ